MQLIIFGIYLAIVFLIFGYMAIVVIHISEFRQYSRYLAFVLRLYLILMFCIGIYGGYKILAGKHIPVPRSNAHHIQKIDF